MTDKKNNHSDKLVNRVIDELLILRSSVQKVVILRGNHDYVDETLPYFKFLKNLEGFFYINQPAVYKEQKELFFPHYHDGFKVLQELDLTGVETIYMHQLVNGVKLENNYKLENDFDFSDYGDYQIFSGDAHVPQMMGNLVYIGSPYPIRFGDDFKGRAIYFDNPKQWESIYFKSKQRIKAVITTPEELDRYVFCVGDQVKVVIQLAPSEFCNYQKIRKQVKEYFVKKEVALVALELQVIKRDKVREFQKEHEGLKVQSPLDIFNEYAKDEKLEDNLITVGKEFL